MTEQLRVQTSSLTTGCYVGANPHSPAVCAERLLRCCSSRCAARAHATNAVAAAGQEGLHAAPADRQSAQTLRTANRQLRMQVLAVAAATAHAACQAAVVAIAAAVARLAGAPKAAGTSSKRLRGTC